MIQGWRRHSTEVVGHCNLGMGHTGFLQEQQSADYL